MYVYIYINICVECAYITIYMYVCMCVSHYPDVDNPRMPSCHSFMCWYQAPVAGDAPQEMDGKFLSTVAGTSPSALSAGWGSSHDLGMAQS